MKDLEKFNKDSSFVLVLICALVLIIGGCVLFIKSYIYTPPVQHILISSNSIPDSTRAFNYMDKAKADSVVNELKLYESQLSQKYQYIVEQKEQDQIFFSGCSLILAIVFSVVGWFGYKSFNTLEDKANKKATEIAKNESRTIARLVAKAETQTFLNKNLQTNVTNAAKDIFNSSASRIMEAEIKDNLVTYIDKKVSDINDNEELDNLDERLNKLETEFKKLEEINQNFANFLIMYNYMKNKKKGDSE